MLGRLRKFDTSERESTFDMDGRWRLGDYDNKQSEWKLYHWGNALLGCENSEDMLYILPDITGSTKIIFSDTGVVNRLDYDFLGFIRNQTTSPQIELLFGKAMKLEEVGLYLGAKRLYDPLLGIHFQTTGSGYQREFGDITTGGGGTSSCGSVIEQEETGVPNPYHAWGDLLLDLANNYEEIADWMEDSQWWDRFSRLIDAVVSGVIPQPVGLSLGLLFFIYHEFGGVTFFTTRFQSELRIYAEISRFQGRMLCSIKI